MHLKRLLTLGACLFANTLATAAEITPAFDKDVERLTRDFNSSDIKVLDEALVQLSWAGLTDPRIYDPLLKKLNAPNNLSDMGARKYIEAITMSGNPAVHAELEKLSQNKSVASSVRSKARDSMKEFGKYEQIAATMSVGLDAAKTNEELWALRHKNGLAVPDSHRVRLAARDLYLHGYGRESLDVAAQTLRDNTDKVLTDRRYVDAMAFLCKALGLAGKPEYKDTLIFVANNTKTEKVKDYAERAAQYYVRSFKAENNNVPRRYP